jgi:hypothetical protein
MVPLLCLTVALGSAAALAEPSGEAEALRHYQLGVSRVQQKAYGEAIAEFNQAYDIGHDFAVLYDIGQAYLAIDEPTRALKALRNYLAEGGKHVPTARRKEVEDEIAKQQQRVATVVLRAKLPGVMVKVDGVEVGKTPLGEDLDLKAGAHTIAASAQGYRPWEQKLELAGGDRRNLDVVLESDDSPLGSSQPPAGGAGPAEQTAAEAAAPVSGPFPVRRAVAYGLGGVGVAAVVVGSVFGLRAISKRNDSDAQCPANQCSQAAVDLNNQAKTAARVADVTIGLGLLSAAVATYLLLTAPPSEAQTPAAARPLRLAADLGPGQAGVVLRGAW